MHHSEQAKKEVKTAAAAAATTTTTKTVTATITYTIIYFAMLHKNHEDAGNIDYRSRFLYRENEKYALPFSIMKLYEEDSTTLNLLARLIVYLL